MTEITECEKRLKNVKECSLFVIIFVCGALFLTAITLGVVQYYYFLNDELISIMIMIAAVSGIYMAIPIVIWIIWYLIIYFKMYIPVKKSKYKEMKKKIKEFEN